MGFFTRPRGSPPLVMIFPTTCFCSDPMESLQHLFFYCPLAVSVFSCVQSLMFLASPLFPTLLLRHALFDFSSDELSVVPKVFF